MTEAVLVKTLVVVKSDHTEHAGGGGVTQEGRSHGCSDSLCVCVCLYFEGGQLEYNSN